MKAHNRRAEKKICIARWHPRLKALVQELKTQNTAEQEIAVSVLENDASLSLAAGIRLHHPVYRRIQQQEKVEGDTGISQTSDTFVGFNRNHHGF